MKYENFKNGNFTIKEKKTGKNRVITFNDELKKIVTRNAMGEKGFIFLGKSGDLVSVQYLNQALKKIAEKYKLEGNISTHTLRKTFGRRIWDKNNRSDEALLLLSEVFNHSNIATTKRYLGIKQQEIANVYLSL
jgi:integrase